MRDMAANLGDLLFECYICESKPPKLQAISHRRSAPRFLLGSSPRAAHSLTKTSTTKSRAIFPLRMTGWLLVLLYVRLEVRFLLFFSLSVFLFSLFQHLFAQNGDIFAYFLKKPFTFLLFYVIIWGEIEIIIFN